MHGTHGAEPQLIPERPGFVAPEKTLKRPSNIYVDFIEPKTFDQIKILWDDQTMRYLNFETTYYLQGDLLKRLQEIL